MLYANCVMVKGHQRTAIYDLQRFQIHFIPNSIAGIFDHEQYLVLGNVIPELDDTGKEILFEYLNNLLCEDIGFYCTIEEIPLFPKLDTTFRIPSHVTNCLMDARDELWYLDDQLVDEINRLCCHYIQIRFWDNPSLVHLGTIAEKIKGSRVKNVEIVLPANPREYGVSSLQALCGSYPQLQSWILYGDDTDVIHEPDPATSCRIVRTTQVFKGETHCGQVAMLYFAVNKLHYFESLQGNTCLNRKVSIDKDGLIKNCPSMSRSFGSIKDTSLSAAIAHPDFKKLWDIKKDEIDICKDCEFRHVCTDCRAYLDHPGDNHSKPLKCGYDPYTCQWSEWSTNPLKNGAIQFYNL